MIKCFVQTYLLRISIIYTSNVRISFFGNEKPTLLLFCIGSLWVKSRLKVKCSKRKEWLYGSPFFDGVSSFGSLVALQ